VDCATTFQKLHEDSKQRNSTFTLRTCHCAECGTIQIWKIIICTPKQTQTQKHFAKNIVLDCATNFQEVFHPPSVWSFALFLTSDRGRFGCCFYTLGGAVQGSFELWHGFCWGPLTQGYKYLSPTGNWPEKDSNTFSKFWIDWFDRAVFTTKSKSINIIYFASYW